MRDLTVAVFRPDDERLADAVELIDSLGARAVPDPMLEIEPTGAAPRTDADYVIFTSKTGVELTAETGWDPGSATVCAIGSSTADVLREAGYRVDVVPEEYTSSGLVSTLDGHTPNRAEGDPRTDGETNADVDVDGARVEVARSDHGSAILLEGLEEAGAYVHETVLYRLARPDGSGESTALAAAGDLDVVLFTSSLTVEHFLEAATERGVREEAISGLEAAIVGAIGPPTRETAESHGIDVDVVPDRADVDELTCTAVEMAAPTYHE